jgi:transcriptional regulator with XRE-family HTH domain
MSILSENLKHLRAQKKLPQRVIADELLVSRGAYEKYESGHSQPPNETLIRISRYFYISIDLLLTLDLTKFSLDSLLELGGNRILLPITVDSIGENKIEIIPYKGKMGYLSGYNDPGYIGSLQHISLPFLRNGKFRAFPVEGDSMPPYKDGTFIVGQYIENIQEMKVDKTYLFITQNDGFSYKRLVSKGEKSVWVKSDNPYFEPYEIPLHDLIEVWQYTASILTDEYELMDFADSNVKETFLSLKLYMEKLEKYLIR